MSEPYTEIFSRNSGFLSEAEQAKLQESRVAVAGVGGVGGLLAERLVRLGVGHLRIADPETFELSNFNRQFCSSISSLGRNKAEVVFEHIKDINPLARVEYGKGRIATAEDARSFVEDCDLVVDEMDFGLFRESILLQRAARARGAFYMFSSAIGFGALVVIVHPHGLTLEEYNGLDPDVDLDNGRDVNVPSDRICPVVPSYAASMPVDVIAEIVSGSRPAPTTSIGVGLAAVLAAHEAANILLGKRDIAAAPNYTYVDLMDRRFTVGTVS